MGNNQAKKLAAEQFNADRQKKIDDAPREAEERRKQRNSPEAKLARHRARIVLAATIGMTGV
mgnify:CR=1 FL=1